MPKPDFLIIGAQKCGTSSLFYLLNQHPDLNLPSVKEIQFFTLEYDKGWNWYKKQFPSGHILARKMTGEASPYYLYHPLVPARVARHLPAVKLIIMMRDPVDRAYSHFWHEKRYQNEWLGDFEEAVALEHERTSLEEEKLIRNEITHSQPFRSFGYIARGLYYKQISRWLQYFPLNQMHFIKSELFFQNPEKDLTELFRFLRISTKIPENLTPQNTNEYPEMPSEIRKKILGYFREDQEKLAALLGQPFQWNLNL